MQTSSKTPTRTLVWSLSFSLLVPALPKAQEPKAPAQAPTIKAEVNLFNLFATVRDKNKSIVTDLKQDDF